MPTAIQRSQSSGAHCHPALAVDARRCPLQWLRPGGHCDLALAIEDPEAEEEEAGRESSDKIQQLSPRRWGITTVLIL